MESNCSDRPSRYNVSCMNTAPKESKHQAARTLAGKSHPMGNILAVLFILLAFSACVTRTTEGRSEAKDKEKHTVWIWQKDFWTHK